MSAHHRLDANLAIGYCESVTWNEVIRKLKAAGFVENRGVGDGGTNAFYQLAAGFIPASQCIVQTFRPYRYH